MPGRRRSRPAPAARGAARSRSERPTGARCGRRRRRCPSEMSSIACAVAASCRPSARRIGKPGVRPLAERGTRPAERAGDDEQVAGHAPRRARARARCGRGPSRSASPPRTRSDRRRRPGRRSRRSPRRARSRPRRRSSAGTASAITSASGIRARGREIAEARRGGAPAELAPADPVEAEMHVLDERVLGHDQPAGRAARRRSRRRRSARAARARPAGRAHRASIASSTTPLSVGSVAARIQPHRQRRRGCILPRWRRRCRRWRPPGRRPRRRSRAEPASADRRDPRPPSRASPRPARRRGSRRRPRAPPRASPPTGRAAARAARARSAPWSPWPRCTPSAAECERSVDVVVHDERRRPSARKPRPRSTTTSVGALTRSCTTVAPAATARFAVSRSRDDRVHPHAIRALASSVAGSSAASAS